MPRKITAKKATKNTSKKSTKTVLPVKSTQQVMPMKSYVKNPRLWVGLAVIVVAVVLFTFKGLFIAAVVNGQPISRLSVVSALEQQSGKQALDNLVVESLVTQEAQKRNITVSQGDINTQVTQIENQLKGQGMTLDDALAQRGMTRNDLIDQLKLQEMLDKMVGSVQVSDADIQNYINNNQDSLPKDLSDADLKAQVKSQLQQQALQNKTQTFVATLQKNAKISYFVNY